MEQPANRKWPAPDFSVVVPLYNEEDNVALLHGALTDALAEGSRSYEIILVDDGSKDATLSRAIELTERDSRVRVVEFQRNYGQTAAMAAGIHTARGQAIVTMDGDLQNDPRDIPELLALIDQGNDMVAGWRRKRQDEGKRVFISKIANRIINKVLGVQVRDSGCSLKAFRRELIQSLPFHGEMHRFIPALSQLAGAQVAQVQVRHHARQFGVSKYGFSRIYKVALDIISIHFLLRYARRPKTWLVGPIASLFASGVLIVILVEAGPRNAMVLWSIGVLLLSAAGHLAALAALTYMLSVVEPRVGQYAGIAAKLLAKRVPAGESGS
ncbi:glycosyltransferase family 2 protein [Sphingomonas aerophila]|uniref:Glycosyltransferase involved in cell wall biosynthesis n=1 Tax=Sphingomonas aerophila TaxID=1344948 RepID=A0A7W9EVZ5_9SPHN|nr:glycosyltransferase family 2 protein [Sphingomonas aerophila]MBB5716869.1 glycosyltransferase involved in cell wall biosynthesis [Sphingomonas aerophila]